MQRPSSSTAADVGVDRSMTHPETTGAGETPVPQRMAAAADTDHERPVPTADERVDAPPRADRATDAMQQARHWRRWAR